MIPSAKKTLPMAFLVIGAFGGGYFVKARQSQNGGTTPQLGSHEHKNKVQYTCPMHPSIISDEPGNCPICGMPLQKVDTFEVPEQASTTDQAVSEVDGRTTFSLPMSRQQLIGVTKGPVQEVNLESEIRASGKVAFDPDLYAAIEEYRQGAGAIGQMKDSPYLNLSEQSRGIAESSRVRLRLMGLTDSQIRQLSNSNSDPMNLILPKGNAWIYAEVYEYEASSLKAGQSIEVSSPSITGEVFLGKILSISPVLNTQTRTFRVRALVPDPRSLLRPDMFINAKIKVSRGVRLAVSTDAVLHSGEQTFVFVVDAAGKFTPRAIQIGAKAQDFYEVLSGLSKGETVVTSANFLIDSESRLRSALKAAGESRPLPAGSPEKGSAP